jgi:hypothetical protein
MTWAKKMTCRAGDEVTEQAYIDRLIDTLNDARRQVMGMYGGNLDHPALDHLELAMAEVIDTERKVRRG